MATPKKKKVRKYPCSKAEHSTRRTFPTQSRTYDPMIIAQELIDWVKLEDSINMAQFCADKGYLPTLIWRLDLENADFSEAFTLTKLKLAERRERKLNGNQLNYGTWQRYQRGLDPFLAKDEDDKDDKDAARKQGIVEKEQANLFLLAKMAAGGKIRQKD